MNFTESNTWFYTLSTISQTCAAILALGGTFVVFKLDKVKTAIDNYRGRVVGLLQFWRKGTKAPDKFYDESDQDILKQYREIVKANPVEPFDRDGFVAVYESFERSRYTMSGGQGIYLMDNGVTLDHDERKRWCNRMADLLEKNINLNNRIYRYLLFSILLLATSIIISVGLLIAKPLALPIGVKTLVSMVGFAILSIGYSAFAVWKIARAKPIT
jgi:hypothetical protein